MSQQELIRWKYGFVGNKANLLPYKREPKADFLSELNSALATPITRFTSLISRANWLEFALRFIARLTWFVIFWTQ